MPPPNDTHVPRLAMRTATCLAGVLVIAACASTARTPPAAPAPAADNAAPAPAPAALVRGDNGFTITETVEVPAQVRADYDSAMGYLRAGQHAPGIALLVRVTEAVPGIAGPLVDLGIAYGLTDELDKAEASLRKALQINPHHPIANNELGRILRRKGQFAAARESYERALQEAPELHFARLNLAILCDIYLADLQCALENYTAYQQAVPDDRQAATWVADLRARAAK